MAALNGRLKFLLAVACAMVAIAATSWVDPLWEWAKGNHPTVHDVWFQR